MNLSREQYKERISQHKLSVLAGLQRISDEISRRGREHDDDKFEPDVFEQFYINVSKFDNIKLGTPEYMQNLEDMRPAITKHYLKNDHHPEHFENGINGMNLLSIMEMLVDWKSANSAYGNKMSFSESMKINKERFNIDEQLYSILINTAIHLGYLKGGENDI